MGATLESVASQGIDEIEHLIVDGGSSDPTEDIVESFRGDVDWRSEPDEGIADAFNKGIARATGELIGIINSDDWYEPDALKSVWSIYDSLPLRERHSTVLHGDLVYHHVCGTKRLVRPRFRWNWNWHWSFYFDMPVHHPTCFIPSTVYERVGLYRTDYRVAMDFEWIIRAWKSGVKFRYIPAAIANFRCGGVSTRRTRLALNEVYRAQRSHSLARIPVTASFLAKSAVNRFKRLIG